MSIIKLSPECQQYYQDLKINNKYQGILYKINKSTNQIVIDKTIPNDSPFKSLTDCLNSDDNCKIIVYRYKSNEEGVLPKLFFIYYGPEKSTQEDRILYSNSKIALSNTLKGIDVKIAGTKIEELSESVFKERIKPKSQA